MFNAKTVDNFLSIEESNNIIEFAKAIETWETGDASFWSNRCLSALNVYENYDKDMGILLYNIREKVGQEIKRLYGLPEVYPDLFQIIRWFPGMEQAPHADDMTDSPDHNVDWFQHREFGAIVYLNDNYSGGHTYYPNHNFDIKPEAGKLAIHPGDPEHLHGVTKIEDGTRYTLASFWTQDKKYFDGWVL
jgi:prolyl 4-hydroxylase